MKFAQYFEYLLEKYSPTKKALADKMGISNAYIINVTKGHSKPPTSERLEQISQILRIEDTEKKKLFELAREERLGEKDFGFQQVIGNAPRVEHKAPSINDELIERKQLVCDLNQWAAQAPLTKIKSVIELLKK